MDKEITGVESLLESLNTGPSEPGQRSLPLRDEMYGQKDPTWGPAASLDAGDVGSRIGIDMGEPTVKAAALRHALLTGDPEMVKTAVGLGAALNVGRRAATWGAKALGRGGAKSRKFFSGRRAKSRVAAQEAKAGRRAAYETKTQGMGRWDKFKAGLGFHGKESGRVVGGASLTTGGVGLTASDVASEAGKQRRARRGVSGYGG